MNTTDNKILSTDYEIIIDCAPFTPRPDTILSSVLLGTNLVPDDFINTSVLFGSWAFVPIKEKEQLYLENQDIIGIKLKQLHSTGKIRYAEW